ncbi:MAG: hypothetical protein V3U57_09110 [Robiginitomaculum sp.]
MDTNNIIDIAGREAITDTLTDLLRTGAQRRKTSVKFIKSIHIKAFLTKF